MLNNLFANDTRTDLPPPFDPGPFVIVVVAAGVVIIVAVVFFRRR